MRSVIKQFDERISRPPVILILFAAVIVIRTVMALPQDPSGLNPILGEMDDPRIPDVRLSYDSDELYHFMQELGEEGRRAYGRMLMSLDLLFPFAYGFWLTGFLLLLSKSRSKRFPAAILLPLGAAVSDLMENGITLYLLCAYPERHPVLAETTSLLKIPKFGLLIPAALMIITLTVIRLNGRRKERTKHPGEPASS
jgi:hypothetical protein